VQFRLFWIVNRCLNGLVGSAISKHSYFALTGVTFWIEWAVSIASDPHSVVNTAGTGTLPEANKVNKLCALMRFACDIDMGLAHTGCIGDQILSWSGEDARL